MTYPEWNNQIAKHFFNSEKAGLRVWLSVERDLIDEIAQKNGVDFDNFIEAVKNGPDLVNLPKGTICSKAVAVYKYWQKNKEKFEYPPYIAYLALFVLAVNHGDSADFSENNYYGRLKDIVKENLTTSHFKRTADLWDDLESWSLEDKKSGFGEFHNDIAGKHVYVGKPLYQIILKTQEKGSLSNIFWKMGWDSDSHPTEAEIIKALKSNKNLLSARTVKRIDKGKPDFLSVLTDRVLEELRNYDESEQTAEDTDKESAKRGVIEICLDIDETAQTAKFHFRCKRKASLPEESFMIKSNGSEWDVIPSSSSLSEKIERFAITDWKKDLTVESEKYRFHYRGEKYKIFTSASDLGASVWISGQRLLPGRPFYLAAHDSLSEKIQEWGRLECDICRALDFDFSGLPKEWRLFKIQGVRGDTKIKHDMPALAIDKKLRMRFEGGIRLNRGNHFFNFAPPKIFIAGGSGQIPVPVYQTGDRSGELEKIPGEAHIFRLPDDIPCGENIKIKVKTSEVEAQKNIKLVKNRLTKFHNSSSQRGMDRFGKFKHPSQETSDESNISETEHLTGAYCHGFKSKSAYPKLRQSSFKKIYLAGSSPTQIIDWPANSWPEAWGLRFG